MEFSKDIFYETFNSILTKKGNITFSILVPKSKLNVKVVVQKKKKVIK
jgi:hypothetical protein